MSGLAIIVDRNRPARDQIGTVLNGLAWRGEHQFVQAVDPMCAMGVQSFRDRSETRPMSVSHSESGCVAIGDIRLDERADLAVRVNISSPQAYSDLDLALRAYVHFGEDCARHLLGDFAFAVWDPRTNSLFAARDHMGLKPLHYACPRPGLLVIASDARAVARHLDVPNDIDERRIADFLEVRAYDDDRSLTFFHAVKRLPPAHTLTFDEHGLFLRRYWRLTPGEPIELAGDDDYAAAFRDVFGRAVDARLRGTDTAGIMLSGGMDSGAVAAMACRDGSAGVHGYSVIDGDNPAEVETRMIALLADHLELETTRIDWQTLGGEASGLAAEYAGMEEPCDWEMVLPHAVYRAAAADGVSVMLDGVSGDTSLAAGDIGARLVRAGQWREALRHFRGEKDFVGGNPGRKLASAAARVLLPDSLLAGRRRLRDAIYRLRPQHESLATRSFAARQIAVSRALAKSNPVVRNFGSDAELRASAMTGSYVTVAREFYERAAARYGIEARDPWCDIRVLQFLLDLPPNRIARAGWPKWQLRQAMVPLLPDAFIRRRGKEHLGWEAIRRLSREAAFPPGGDLPLPPMVRGLAHGRESRDWNRLKVASLAGWLAENGSNRDI